MKFWAAVGIMWAIVSTAVAADLLLPLPETIPAVPGIENRIFFDAIDAASPPRELAYHVECAVGEANDKCWRWRPDEKSIGRHPIKITVCENAKEIGSVASVIEVVPRGGGRGRNEHFMAVGDSLTVLGNHRYLRTMCDYIQDAGEPPWSFDSISIQAVSGWGYAHFLFSVQSKFIIANDPENEKGHFDLSAVSPGGVPLMATVFLGINDCVRAASRSSADAGDANLRYAKIFIVALARSMPNGRIGVALPPLEAAPEAFLCDFKGRISRDDYRRARCEFTCGILKWIAKHPCGGRISVVPVHLEFDPEHDYWAGQSSEGEMIFSALHPNSRGYSRIGKNFYCWVEQQFNGIQKK